MVAVAKREMMKVVLDAVGLDALLFPDICGPVGSRQKGVDCAEDEL